MSWQDEHYCTIIEQFAQCGVCFQGVILRDYGPENPFVLPLAKDDIPEHLPENVGRFFRQGVDNVKQRNWDAAGSMFRKTLESALKHRFPDNAKNSLATQIKKAVEDRKLTPEMAEWADQIRFWGNEAAHEDEPFTEEDARQMGEFTELFLTYLFTLPEKLTRARDQK